MVYEYFIWNLPLFATRSLIEERICLTFGKCSVDVFQPRLPKHSTHAGMARIMSRNEYNFGEKSPLDLGFRYPAFIKESSRPDLKTWKPDNCSPDLVSDEKTDDSSFSISICPSIDITYPLIVLNESINIAPEADALKLTCENFMTSPICSDLTSDFDLQSLTIAPETPTCILTTVSDLTTACIEATCDFPELTVQSELAEIPINSTTACGALSDYRCMLAPILMHYYAYKFRFKCDKVSRMDWDGMGEELMKFCPDEFFNIAKEAITYVEDGILNFNFHGYNYRTVLTEPS